MAARKSIVQHTVMEEIADGLPANPGKLARPVYRGLVPRQRLFSLLDKARATWVTGPPGSGKTALLSSWVEARGVPCLWYRLDPYDSDIASFFFNLRAAAMQALGAAHKDLPLPTPECTADVPGLTRRFFERLFSGAPGPVVLVFDNYHSDDPASPLHEVIAEGLLSIPATVRVVFTSRGYYPPSLSPYRIQHGMNILGWEALRLTEREALDIAKRRGYRHGPDAAREVNERCQGWAAGFVLLLEVAPAALRDVSLGEQSFGSVFNYFAAEVFSRTDPATREFLLKTSLLPKLSVSTARALTWNERAWQILAALHADSYFTERVPGEEDTYRYHPLFRDFLLGMARHELPAPVLSGLSLKAAELLEQAGQIREAASLYIEWRDWHGLSALVCNHTRRFLREGKRATIQGWIRLIPEDMRRENPRLLYWLGSCLMETNLPDAKAAFQRALEMFDACNDPKWSFLAWAGVVETILCERADFGRLDEWLSRLDRLLAKYPVFPSARVEGRVVAIMFGALMFHRPQDPSIPHWASRIRALLESTTDETARIMAGNHLAIYYIIWVGDHAKAGAVLDLIRPSEISKVRPLAQVMWHALQGLFRWATCSFSEGLRSFEEGRDIAETSGVRAWDFTLFLSGILNSLSTGDTARGRELLQTLASRMDRTRQLHVAHWCYHAAWEAMLRDDSRLSLEHAEAAMDIASRLGDPFTLGVMHGSLAQALYACGRRDEAREVLDAGVRLTREQKAMLVLCRHLIVRAYFELDGTEQNKAVESLREAFAISREKGYLNFSWWRRNLMARVCVKALEEGIEVEWVSEMVRRRNLVPEEPPVHLDTWPWPLKVHALGRFEIAKDGEPLVSSGKVQQKPLLMLKALVAQGGRSVSEEQLSDILWPDAEGDLAHRAFETTLYRLRQLLGDDAVLQLKGGLLTVDGRRSWVDSWTFEHVCGQAETHWRNGNGRGPQEAMTLSERAIGLYQGDFLPAENREAWAVPTRERLRSKFLKMIMRLGKHWEHVGEYDHALQYFERGLEVDELAEELHQHVMACHHRLGRRSDAVRAYERCRSALSCGLGVTPSEKTEEIIRTIRPVTA